MTETANKIDVMVVAGILGHRDVSTTLNVYAIALEESKREAMDTMDIRAPHKRPGRPVSSLRRAYSDPFTCEDANAKFIVFLLTSRRVEAIDRNSSRDLSDEFPLDIIIVVPVRTFFPP